MIKYSIVIPCYNVEEYINTCLGSLFKQTYKEFEVIIIDDGSTDNTFSIAKKYELMFDYCTIVKQDVNTGVSIARNKGIELAKGKYILFIDADDFVADDYLETIDKYDLEKLDLLSFGNYNYISLSNKSNRTTNSKMNINADSDWQKLLISSFFSSPWNKRYNKSIIKNNHIAFMEGLVCYEDLMFNLDYCKYVNNFKLLDKPLYYYRQDGNVDNSKRKWPGPFYISDTVYDSIINFIDSKKDIKGLYLYPYASYLIELSFIENKKELKKAIRALICSDRFKDTVSNITNKGKRIDILAFALRKNIDTLSMFIIKSLVRSKKL